MKTDRHWKRVVPQRSDFIQYRRRMEGKGLSICEFPDGVVTLVEDNLVTRHASLEAAKTAAYRRLRKRRGS